MKILALQLAIDNKQRRVSVRSPIEPRMLHDLCQRESLLRIGAQDGLWMDRQGLDYDTENTHKNIHYINTLHK